MLREVATIVMIVILVALFIGAAIFMVEVPCDPKVQTCMDKP